VDTERGGGVKAKAETVKASEIAKACGFALEPWQCRKCGGCGSFSSRRFCECNPDRMSVDACFREQDQRKEKYLRAKYPRLYR
jgi:hypothetical protein